MPLKPRASFIPSIGESGWFEIFPPQNTGLLDYRTTDCVGLRRERGPPVSDLPESGLGVDRSESLFCREGLAAC